MKTIIEIANEYRAEYGRAGGVVIVTNGDVGGWMNELRDPQHWVPGSIAIDRDGNAWVAFGGDDYNGAQYWQPVGAGNIIARPGADECSRRNLINEARARREQSRQDRLQHRLQQSHPHPESSPGGSSISVQDQETPAPGSLR